MTEREPSPTDEPRVPAITTREQLPEADRHHFDAIEASRGTIPGPYTVLLHSPELATRLADVGAYVRFEGELDEPLKELAILATAFEWECAYVWAAHEPYAREVGVDPAAVDVVAGSASPDALPEPAASVVRFGRALLQDGRVSSSTYDEVEAVLGPRGVTELVATIGYYSVASMVCNAFDVRPDDSAPFQ